MMNRTDQYYYYHDVSSSLLDEEEAIIEDKYEDSVELDTPSTRPTAFLHSSPRKNPRTNSIKKVVFTASFSVFAVLLTLFLFGFWGSKRILRGPSLEYASTYEETTLSQKPLYTYQDDVVKDHNVCKSFRDTLALAGVKYQDRHPTHLAAALGIEDLFSGPKCLTYKDRFDSYSDDALGIDYRNVVVPDKDGRSVQTDRLQGPIKPQGYSSQQWTDYLRRRNTIINTRYQEDKSAKILDWKALSDRCGLSGERIKKPKKRTAILLRVYEEFVMTEDQVLDLRAMLAEMVINRPKDGWDIRILVELHQTPGALVSKHLQEKVLKPLLPREFWGLVEFWSQDYGQNLLPGVSSNVGYDIKMSCLLASQLFSIQHPEYDFIYNWEADLRFLGDYSIFFNNVEEFAFNDPMSENLDEYQNWLVRNSSRSEKIWSQSSSSEGGRSKGGKEADLITFNTMHTVNQSGWVHSADMGNYGSNIPFKASIVSSVRFSKALLKAMNLAIVEKQKSMQCEAWPVSVVLHSHLAPSSNQTFDQELMDTMGDNVPFKAVFVPHPVYFAQEWDPARIESEINRQDYFNHESFMASSTFNWMSIVSGGIYERWRHGQDEHDACRRPALMHPIKNVGY